MQQQECNKKTDTGKSKRANTVFDVVIANGTLPRSHSCVAAISAVIISGDWEGSVLFHDSETKANLAFVEKAHPGGVTAATAFSSHDEEELYFGLFSTHTRIARFVYLTCRQCRQE